MKNWPASCRSWQPAAASSPEAATQKVPPEPSAPIKAQFPAMDLSAAAQAFTARCEQLASESAGARDGAGASSLSRDFTRDASAIIMANPDIMRLALGDIPGDIDLSSSARPLSQFGELARHVHALLVEIAQQEDTSMMFPLLDHCGTSSRRALVLLTTAALDSVFSLDLTRTPSRVRAVGMLLRFGALADPAAPDNPTLRQLLCFVAPCSDIMKALRTRGWSTDDICTALMVACG